MKYNVKVILIFILLFLIGFFILNKMTLKEKKTLNRHKIKKNYISDTFLDNGYEIYSDNDPFYLMKKYL